MKRGGFSALLEQRSRVAEGCGDGEDALAEQHAPEVGHRAPATVEATSLLPELRKVSIDGMFDHPRLLDLIWGPEAAAPAADAAAATGRPLVLGGLRCTVFGREEPLRAKPTVLLFLGQGVADGGVLESIAQAYVSGHGAQVVVPAVVRKLSHCLQAARAVAAALPSTMGPGPLIIHSVGTGCIPALQVAAEQSQPRARPQASLLVLESGVPSLQWIPGAQPMLGCMALDPLGHGAKLKAVGCPVVLVRGASVQPPPGVDREPVDLLADMCSSRPAIARTGSSLAQDGALCPAISVAVAAITPLASAALDASQVDESGVLLKVMVPTCLVRAGLELQSAELGRLRKGAVVMPLEQRGARLRVRKVDGEGPEEGWVSTAVAGAATLCPLE